MALLDASGLPRPRMNADLAVRGRFFEVDCLWERERVAVELDGGAVHRHQEGLPGRPRTRPDPLAEGWRPIASPGIRSGTNSRRSPRPADGARAAEPSLTAARQAGLRRPGGRRPRSTLYQWIGSSSTTTCAMRRRRGPAADGAFTGAAGGAACGDLSRISCTVADGPDRRRHLRRRGLRGHPRRHRRRRRDDRRRDGARGRPDRHRRQSKPRSAA